MTEFYVEVVDILTGEVVKRLGPHSEWKAEKVEAGMNINLNHERYYTRIEEE